MSTLALPPVPASHRSTSGDLRLTRRGRVVVTLLFLVLVTVTLTFFSGYSAATGAAGDVPPVRTVVVAEGDTLWSLAARVPGPDEIREVVHEIQELNSLADPALSEGQRIAVPTP